MRHIHSQILDNLNIDELVKQLFHVKSDNRMTTYGEMQWRSQGPTASQSVYIQISH